MLYDNVLKNGFFFNQISKTGRKIGWKSED